MKAFGDLRELELAVGQEVAVSDPIVITQELIDGFANSTGDRQWIHVDADRAARESPHGRTIAHGFLLLSLLPRFLSAVRIGHLKSCLNLGLGYARFLSAVPVDARLRARFRLQKVRRTSAGELEAEWYVMLECEGAKMPAVVCEWRVRYSAE